MSELITEEKQKFCKHCGEKIPEDAVLCTHCGRQVENITQSAANTPNIVINNANSNVNTNNNTIRGVKKAQKQMDFIAPVLVSRICGRS